MTVINLGNVRGEKGEDGNSYQPNATGILSEKSAYDNEEIGFSFLATDTGDIYFIEADGWSEPVAFAIEGEQGIQGIQGIPGIKGDPGVAFEIGSDTPTERFDTYELGVSGTVDGEIFGVLSSDEKVMKIYENVDGFGVYVRTIGWEAGLLDYTFIKKSIDYGSIGFVPSGAIIDFDSSEIFNAQHKIKNLGTGNNPDERFLTNINAYAGVPNGGTSAPGAPDTNGGTTGFEITLPAVGTTGGAPPFSVASLSNTQRIPAGQWTFAFDIRLLDGEADTLVSFEESWGFGVFPAPSLLLTDEWQTISRSLVFTADESYMPNYQLAIAQKSATPTTELKYYMCNFRLVAGSVPLEIPAIQSDILSKPRFPVLNKYAEGMLLDLTEAYDGDLMIYFPTPIVFKEGSFAVTFKMFNYGGGNRTVFFKSEGGMLVGLSNGALQCLSSFIPNINLGGKMPLNEWLTIVVIAGKYGSSTYLNGTKLTSYSDTAIEKTINYFGLFNDGYDFNGQVSSFTLWDRALTEKEVEQASDTSMNRLRIKGGTPGNIKTVYRAEGDSLTAINYNFTPLIAMFDPPLFSTNAAANGRGLGAPGDTTAQNTLFGQLEYTLEYIKNHVNANRVVIVSVFIGANGIAALTTPELREEFYDNIKIYWNTLRAAGAKVIAATITDNSNAVDKTPWDVNDLLLSDDTQYDAIADYYGDSRLTPATPTYFYDGQHETELGGAVMVEILQPKIALFWE